MSHRIDWSFDQGKLLKQILKRPHLIGRMVGRDLLQEQHSDWIRWAWGQPSGIHTGTQCHRGSYKTTSCTEIGPILRWLLYPNCRIALVRETYKVAAETLATVAKNMENPVIQSLFSAVHGEGAAKATINREGKLEFAFKKTSTKEGNMESFGILGVPTGFHCDKVIGDDFVTKEDKYSRAKREKTRTAVEEIQTNIIDPGGECSWVGTPWAKDDAWECVPKPLKFPRKLTGLLPDDKYEDVIFRTLEDGRKVRKISRSQEAANYDLEHIADEGMMFADLAEIEHALSAGKVSLHAKVKARFITKEIAERLKAFGKPAREKVAS